MSKGKPNYVARVVAVLALFAAFAAVIATIATSGGDDDNGDSKTTAEQTGITKKGEKALEEGVWVVDEGDTLVAISEATGIDLDELVALNSDIDPQALITGQRVSLRPGRAGGGDDDSGTTDATDATETTGDDPADEFGDGSVGDDNSSSSDGVTSP